MDPKQQQRMAEDRLSQQKKEPTPPDDTIQTLNKYT